MHWTGVPETTVNENHHARSDKNKIGLSRQASI